MSKKLDNTGEDMEDLISIGTTVFIKAIPHPVSVK
jgi:DNA-directed RNA polymerase specialized sigma subunit